MKYPEITLGRVEAVWNKLGGEEGVVRLLRGEISLTDVVKKVTIGVTDGAKTIAKAKTTFPGYIDSNFENWKLGVAGEGRPETSVEVHELIADAKFSQMFVGDLDQLCLTQHQIIEFCEKSVDWLRTKGYATFFLFKEKTQEEGGGEPTEKFFVAGVRFDGRSRLRVRVRSFGHDDVWFGGNRPRVVLPKLGEVLAA